jgi:hypothetical protein
MMYQINNSYLEENESIRILLNSMVYAYFRTFQIVLQELLEIISFTKCQLFVKYDKTLSLF